MDSNGVTTLSVREWASPSRVKGRNGGGLRELPRSDNSTRQLSGGTTSMFGANSRARRM